MGFFSSLFKVAVKEIKAANTLRVKQSKYGKILSIEEEQLERLIQQYESESDLIYKKLKGPSGKTYMVDVELRRQIKRCISTDKPWKTVIHLNYLIGMNAKQALGQKH